MKPVEPGFVLVTDKSLLTHPSWMVWYPPSNDWMITRNQACERQGSLTYAKPIVAGYEVVRDQTLVGQKDWLYLSLDGVPSPVCALLDGTISNYCWAKGARFLKPIEPPNNPESVMVATIPNNMKVAPEFEGWEFVLWADKDIYCTDLHTIGVFGMVPIAPLDHLPKSWGMAYIAAQVPLYKKIVKNCSECGRPLEEK